MRLTGLVRDSVLFGFIAVAGYFVYQFITDGAGTTKGYRYQPNEQHNSLEERVTESQSPDDCERYVNPEILTSCLEARAKP